MAKKEHVNGFNFLRDNIFILQFELRKQEVEAPPAFFFEKWITNNEK